MTLDFRQVLLQCCTDIVQSKILQIQESVRQSEDSLFNETKSSAGDKYETSREMIQQDLNRLQRQLVEADKDKVVLESLQQFSFSAHVILGSIVQTDRGVYFVSIGLGRIQCDGKEVFVVSPQSPIGKLLLGKKVGEVFAFNGKEQKIMSLA